MPETQDSNGASRGTEPAGGRVAIVGASPGSRMVQDLVANIHRFGYAGEVVGINPRRSEVLGMRCFARLSDVPGPVSAAVVLVDARTSVDIVAEASTLGIDTVSVITAGFAEGGEAGLERRLAAAVGPDTTMYGPNCIGFVDMARSLCAVAQPVPADLRRGPVSVVSQSGGLLTAIMATLTEEGLGVDWCASIGNAARFDLADAVDHVVDRGTSSALCVYGEELADDGRLGRALRRARAAGLFVTLLKPHSTGKGDRLNLSHTASLTEDDHFVDLYCERHGVVRVTSIDELARTAAIGIVAGREIRESRGVAVVGGAGGGSALAIAHADRAGLPLVEFSAETVGYLRGVSAPGSFVENPVDLVRPTATRDEIYRRIFTDPNVDLVLALVPVTFPDGRSDGSDVLHQEGMAAVAALRAETGVPAVISTAGIVAHSEWVDRFRADHPDVPVVRGLVGTINALARMRRPARRPPAAQDGPSRTPLTVGEIAGRELLAASGVELARTVLCKPGDSAADAYAALGSPVVVVKADVAGISHKAAFGAVKVGLTSAEETADAVTEIHEALTTTHGIVDDDVNGFLIQEMVAGREVLAGLSRSGLGTFLTVGRGGGAASAATARTVLLPLSGNDLAEVVTELLPELTQREVGAVGDAVARLVRAFEAPELAGYTRLEVNPFIVDGSRAVAVDVLLEQ